MTDSLGNLAGNFKVWCIQVYVECYKRILAPTALTPAVGWIVSGPKSGAHSSLSFIFSAIPSNCPLRIFLQGSLCEELMQMLHIRSQGTPYFSPTILATFCYCVCLFYCCVTARNKWNYVNGSHSRCCPSCLVISINSTAFPKDATTASRSSSGSLITVTTHLLWFGSVW